MNIIEEFKMWPLFIRSDTLDVLSHPAHHKAIRVGRRVGASFMLAAAAIAYGISEPKKTIAIYTPPNLMTGVYSALQSITNELCTTVSVDKSYKFGELKDIGFKYIRYPILESVGRYHARFVNGSVIYLISSITDLLHNMINLNFMLVDHISEITRIQVERQFLDIYAHYASLPDKYSILSSNVPEPRNDKIAYDFLWNLHHLSYITSLHMTPCDISPTYFPYMDPESYNHEILGAW